MTKPNYRVSKSAIPLREVHPESAANEVPLRSRKVYGNETSIVFAERDPDYHTKPHVHDCEQMNYILSGEIWFYVEGNGYRCREGDVMRIPRNAVHWAWNRSKDKAVVIESHCPPLIQGEEARARVVSLHGPDEDPAAVRYVMNKNAAMDENKVREIEERAFREEG
jgi:quercetin dioxygenase-like cupin family protein